MAFNFGTPSATTGPMFGGGTPGAQQQQQQQPGALFGTPAPTSAANTGLVFNLGTQGAATSTGAGLQFSVPASSAPSQGFSFGTTNTSSAPTSAAGTTALFGTPNVMNPLATQVAQMPSNVSQAQQTTTFRGLGGAAPETSLADKSQAAKSNEMLPPEILALVEQLRDKIRKEKQYRDDNMAYLTSHAESIPEIGQAMDSIIKQRLSAVQIDVDKLLRQIEGLKDDMSQQMKYGELATRISKLDVFPTSGSIMRCNSSFTGQGILHQTTMKNSDSLLMDQSYRSANQSVDHSMSGIHQRPSTQHSFMNVATTDYFALQVSRLRDQMSAYSEQIEELTKYVQAQQLLGGSGGHHGSSSLLGPDANLNDVIRVARRQHETLLVLAARLYMLHDGLERVRASHDQDALRHLISNIR